MESQQLYMVSTFEKCQLFKWQIQEERKEEKGRKSKDASWYWLKSSRNSDLCFLNCFSEWNCVFQCFCFVPILSYPILIMWCYITLDCCFMLCYADTLHYVVTLCYAILWYGTLLCCYVNVISCKLDLF